MSVEILQTTGMPREAELVGHARLVTESNVTSNVRSERLCDGLIRRRSVHASILYKCVLFGPKQTGCYEPRKRLIAGQLRLISTETTTHVVVSVVECKR